MFRPFRASIEPPLPPDVVPLDWQDALAELVLSRAAVGIAGARSIYFIMANVIEARRASTIMTMPNSIRKGFQLSARTSLSKCDGSVVFVQR